MTTLGEYIPLHWDSDPEYEVVRGHLEPEDASAELLRWGIDSADYREREHRWARWVFAPEGADYDRGLRFCERGRGAFAITVFWPKR